MPIHDQCSVQMADVQLLLAPDIFDRLESPPDAFDAPSGRRVAFDQRGDPDGRPCFWFHGSPSCRLEAVLLDSFGLINGHRFIAVDRPGIGQSSAFKGWRMLDHAADVVALADQFGWSRFSVAGGSGGGPFVLAMAAHSPDRIHRAISLACAGAFERDEIKAQIGWVDRLAAWAAPKPGLLDAYFGLVALVARTPESMISVAAEAIQRYLPVEDPRLVMLLTRTVREATRQGLAGIVEDTQVLHQPWGFELESIRVPIDFVNGTKDEFVPFGYGAELAEHVPRARLHTVLGGDHFRTIFDLDRLKILLN